ncbi:MAG: (d)CMP kinase [Deltaproteobacteria bacterium]|nr:(d)CMP kinase [Deltaproteobacteria bacterium]
MRSNGLIIAIDGPAGAGKSTVARELARRLGYVYVDTGAMYRVVGLLAREQGIDAGNGAQLGELAGRLAIRFEALADGTQRVLVDSRDVTAAIREQEVGEWASRVSTRAEVRERMVAAQREIGGAGGVVLEGRDIGTVVFPDADVKFFLEASAAERGRRRHHQLLGRGEAADLRQIAAEIEGRDRRDQAREHSPLRCAPDALRLDSTGLSAAQVVDEMLRRCRDAERARGARQQKP